MPDSKCFVGIDWADGAWLAVAFGDQGYRETLVESKIREIWEAYGADSDYIVDIPIGLCSSQKDRDCGCVREEGEIHRRCDALARKVIGWPRSSSVFTPPAREVVTEIACNHDTGKKDEPDYSAINEKLTGKGLARQSINIAPQIKEVDDLLVQAEDFEALREGHPEVCFRAFNGSKLENSKHSATGIDERLEALEAVPEYDDGLWQEVAMALREYDVNPGIDDVIDAIALALTAVGGDEQWSLPPNAPTDSEGRPMQIVYRAANPFAGIREDDAR